MKHVKQIAIERQSINNAIRSFFSKRGYIEVETPIVVQSPGMEPNLFPLETTVLEPDGTSYRAGLITSPEYAMKKLLGRGMEKIFTITKVFRNKESFGGQHNPEFSMLEWYSQGQDYQACMDETEELIAYTASARAEFSFIENIERIRVRDLFLEHVEIDLDSATAGDLQDTCARFAIQTDASDTESDLFYRLFLSKIEPTFRGRNLFIYDYPKHQAALSRLTNDGMYGERFELFSDGIELCNGFTELTDSQEQRKRFEEEAQERKMLGKHVYPVDETLLAGLDQIQNPTFGNALGIDRLHMVLTGRKTIEETLLFSASDLF